MSLKYTVPHNKQIRVIIDTDAACEADDPFAIVQALLSPKLVVQGIVAEHFNEPGSTKRSFDEIKTILRLLNNNIPVFMGEEGPISERSSDTKLSPACEFIIRESIKEDERPLFILCQGAITNVAVAFMQNPQIIKKSTVVWIGTHGAGNVKAPFREYNAGNDIEAANFVLTSGADIWLIPSFVYSTVNIGIAEIQRRIAPCGSIGRHLFENLVDYNMSDKAGWTKGESWSLGDSPAVGVALNDWCGKYHEVSAPHIEEDTSSHEVEGNPIIREYTSIDSRYILEDLIAKLELCKQDDAI